MVGGLAQEWFDAKIMGALGRLRIVTRRSLSGVNRANRTARRTGSSVEFAEHRTYVPGDDPRLLDWTAYGRLDRLYTRLFHDEEDMHVCLLVDVSRSMHTSLSPDADKFGMARRVAAMLAHVALAGHLQVSLGFFADALVQFSEPLRGKNRFHEVLRLLDSPPVASGMGTSFASSLSAVASASPRRSLIVVVSDFFDSAGIELPLQKLLHRRCDLALVDVYEPIASGALPGGDLIVEDAETGVEVAIDAGPDVISRMAQNAADRAETIRRWAAQFGVPFARISASDPYEMATRALIAAGLLKQ